MNWFIYRFPYVRHLVRHQPQCSTLLDKRGHCSSLCCCYFALCAYPSNAGLFMYDCLFVQHRCLVSVASSVHHTSHPLKWDSAAENGNARNCKQTSHKIAQKFVRLSLPLDKRMLSSLDLLCIWITFRYLPVLLSTIATGNKLILIYAVPDPHIARNTKHSH